MRHLLISAITLSLAVVPATLAAQQPDAGAGRPAHRGMAANPAARVLALPAVLELTAAQVSQLEQIRDRTNAQNQPLLEQLQAARPDRAGRGRGELRERQQERRAELQARREQLKPVFEQLRENATTARREVESVLTSEQVAKLRELDGARRPAGGGRGPRPQR